MNASPPATTNATPLTQIGITVSPTMTRTPRTTRNSCARDTTARRIVAVTVAGFKVVSFIMRKASNAAVYLRRTGRPMGARPGVRCNGMLACLHDRVAQAVARRLAQVRMHQPPTKHPLPLHAHSFEEARRCNVIHVAGRPHPVDHRLRQGPLDHGRHRFTHEALTPPASRERITEIHGTCSHADFD